MSLVLPYMASAILIGLDTAHINSAIFQISHTKYNMFNLVQLLHHVEIITCCNEELLNR